MRIGKHSYEWMWSRLSLFKRGDGFSTRIFTLWPKWVWWWFRDLGQPDPYADCESWLRRNGHWHDEDFMRAVIWYYGNGSKPGELVRLNPKLLK